MKRSLNDLPCVPSFQGFMASFKAKMWCVHDTHILTRSNLVLKSLVPYTSQNINKQNKSREIKKYKVLHVLNLYQCCPHLISLGSLFIGEVPQQHNNTELEVSLGPEIECQVIVQSSTALSPMATSAQIRAHCWYSARRSQDMGS